MTSSLAPTATPITAPAGPPSNAVDSGGDASVKAAGSPIPPSSQVSGDDDDDLPVDVSASLAGLSVDQLVALEAAGSNPAAIAAALGESGAVTVAGADTDDDGAPAVPAAAPATEAVPGTVAASTPGRISLKGLPPSDADMVKSAIGAVKAGTYGSFAEAMAALYPSSAPAASAAAPAASVEDPAAGAPAIEFDPDVELEEPQALVDLRTQLQDLDARFTAAGEAYDTVTQGTLLKERQDLIRKLDKEETKFEGMKAQAAQFEASVDASSERALAQFPDLRVEGSEMYNLLGDEIILARSKGDDILKYPDWPEKIAIRTAEKLKRTAGVVPNPSNQPQPASQIPAPPPQGVRMPGSPIGPGAQVAQLNAATAAAELVQMDPDEQIRALELADRRLQSRR